MFGNPNEITSLILLQHLSKPHFRLKTQKAINLCQTKTTSQKYAVNISKRACSDY